MSEKIRLVHATVRVMSAFLDDFQVIRPDFEASQENILEWLAFSHATAQAKKEKTALNPRFHEEMRERLFKLGLGSNKIWRRSSHIKDIFQGEHAKNEIYNLDKNARGKGINERMLFFEKAVNSLFEKFYPEKCPLPSHLVHVTCTGYVSPSGAQHLVSRRNFGKKCSITHAYHMGCYAAIPAIRIASGLLRAKENVQVDLVHTELCSLHMNPLLHETEQLVVQSLFADGFIKYSVRPKKGALRLLSLREEIIPQTGEQMSWRLDDWGMRMTLTKEIPVSVSRALPSFLKELLGASAKEIFFAIHPGGPKIIEQVQKRLSLSNQQIKHSQAILQNCGNMSSATLPHIWESMVRDPAIKPGALIASLAFGPGLTICGALFRKEKKS